MRKQFLNFNVRKLGLRFLMLSAVALIAVSCQKDEAEMKDEDNSIEYNTIEMLENFSENMSDEEFELKRGYKRPPTFATLTVALARTRLASTVATQRLTVFAPTDAAFAQLGLYPWNIGRVPNLKEILLYHVVGGRVFSNQLSNGFVPTLNGAAVQIDLTKGVKVNDSNVIIANVKTRNGVIHVVDKVLLPPDKNLVDLALSFDPEFSILVQAVLKADLAKVLATGGPFTVFAPTNAAFVALLDELGPTVNSLDDIPVGLLTDVLLYHVVPGRVFSSDLKSGPVETLKGTFTVNLSDLSITDARGRKAGLVPSLLNVQATNGVIHVIDRVILP